MAFSPETRVPPDLKFLNGIRWFKRRNPEWAALEDNRGQPLRLRIGSAGSAFGTGRAGGSKLP